MRKLKKTAKQSLSLFLCLIMVVGMLQVTAFADEPGDANPGVDTGAVSDPSDTEDTSGPEEGNTDADDDTENTPDAPGDDQDQTNEPSYSKDTVNDVPADGEEHDWSDTVEVGDSQGEVTGSVSKNEIPEENLEGDNPSGTKTEWSAEGTVPNGTNPDTQIKVEGQIGRAHV